MKIEKGKPGYLKRKRNYVIGKTVLEFGIVIALLVLGIVQTGDRLNMLTIVAVLGCLPASKALVELIMLLPHKTIPVEMAEEIAAKTDCITMAYDLVLTSEKHIMPVTSIAISEHTICGYTPSEKVDTVFAGKHIKRILTENGYGKVSVKIFDNYTAFLTRAEGMNNIASVEKKDTKKLEQGIRRVLLNISL